MEKIIDVIPLKDGESVTLESKPSKTGLIITWVSIPGLFFIIFLLVYLPQLIRVMFSQAVKEAVMSSLGVESMQEVNVMKYVSDQIWGHIPKLLIVLGMIPFILLILAWLGWCIVMTFRYFRYSVAVTDSRVIGNAAGEILDAKLTDIINVFIEQSLFGKIFNYGNITISSKGKSLTFQNIHNPKVMYRLLKSYAERNSAY